MKRTRLIAALLAGLFALHLTVAGGVARALQSGDMAGMEMMGTAADAAMPAMDASSSDQAPCPDETPCSMPGMPSGHCPSAISCAVAAIRAPDEAALDLRLPLPESVTPSPLPHTRTSPPELPPPRA